MPKKGRIKRIDPIPGDPGHKLLTWEDLYLMAETTEPIPADWSMGQIRQWVRDHCRNMGPVTEPEVTD